MLMLAGSRDLSPAGKRLFSASSVFGLSSLPNSITGNGTETRGTILQDNIIWFSFLKRICSEKRRPDKKIAFATQSYRKYNDEALSSFLQCNFIICYCR
jgi:hypothetical protein